MRTLVLLLFVVAALGCESKTDGDRPTKIAGEDIPSAAKVKKVAKVSNADTCETFYKEAVEACHDAYFRDLDLNCHMLFTKAKMSHKQMKGDLFKDPNGKASPQKIGGATCGVHLKSLRKKRAKKDGDMKDVAWGPKCKQFLGYLEDTCIKKMPTGDFDAKCSSLLIASRNLKPGDKTEKLCEANLAHTKPAK